ncbi:MAG: hypothetical protein HOO06_00770 [Bdellovibrionaceae bacterium]|jgi:hypothetical protein|nr:hypothetical protein [Pseudobdellovibrionaceae bacterium]
MSDEEKKQHLEENESTESEISEEVVESVVEELLDPEDMEINILMIVSDLSKQSKVGSFLERRGWPTSVTKNLGEAIQILSQTVPDFIIVSMSHNNPKITKLPIILAQTFNCRAIVFGETYDSQTTKKLNTTKCPHVMHEGMSGPSLQRRIKRIILDSRKTDIAVENKSLSMDDNSTDTINIKGGKQLKSEALNTTSSRQGHLIGLEESKNNQKAIGYMPDHNKNEEGKSVDAIANLMKMLEEDDPDEDSTIHDNNTKSEMNNYSDEAHSTNLSPDMKNQTPLSLEEQKNLEKEEIDKLNKNRFSFNDKEKSTEGNTSDLQDKDTIENENRLDFDKSKKASVELNLATEVEKKNKDENNLNLEKNKNHKDEIDLDLEQDKNYQDELNLDKSSLKKNGVLLEEGASANKHFDIQQADNLERKNNDNEERGLGDNKNSKSDESSLASNKNNGNSQDQNQEQLADKKQFEENNLAKSSLDLQNLSKNKVGDTSKEKKNSLGKNPDQENSHRAIEQINNLDIETKGQLEKAKNSNEEKEVDQIPILHDRVSEIERGMRNKGNLSSHKKKSQLLKSLEIAMKKSCLPGKQLNKKIGFVKNLWVILLRSEQVTGYLTLSAPYSGLDIYDYLNSFRSTLIQELTFRNVKMSVDTVMKVPVKGVDYVHWMDNKSDCSLLGRHKDFEIGAAFFDNEDIIIEEGTTFKGKTAIDLSKIRPNENLEFPAYIFLEKNNKYYKYLKKGRKLMDQQKDRLLEKQVTDLHIDIKDFEIYKSYYAENELNNMIDGYKKVA